MTVQLVENGWYHVEDDHNTSGGTAVNRAQLLSVLADIKHLLIRAKFHTDQVEGRLANISKIILCLWCL